jgi:hypothetical protein
MALMARTLGIPSRVVFGFTPGERATQSDGAEVIVVRALNAHAWVELYMPGQGWVRFDPTPRGDGINPGTVSQVGFDPTMYLPPPTEQESETPVSPTGELIDEEFLETGSDPSVGLPTLPGTDLRPWIVAILLVFAAGGVVPTIKWVRRASRLKKLAEGDVVAGWAELTDRLTDLGHRPDQSQTPHEVAGSVDRALIPLAYRLTADVYGGRNVTDGTEVYGQAEHALRLRYQGWRWWLSWVQPKSLWPKSPWPKYLGTSRIGVLRGGSVGRKERSGNPPTDSPPEGLSESRIDALR